MQSINVAAIKDFEEMDVWQRSKMLSTEVLKITSQASFRRDYDLIRQMKRSCGSIMDNIAEGFGRGGKREFIQFLYIARGSASELRSQLHRAKDFEYIGSEEFTRLRLNVKEIEGMIYGFIQYLKHTSIEGTKNR